MGDPIDEIDYDNPPFPLTAIDKRVVATRDEDYHRITWEELTEIIGTVSPSMQSQTILLIKVKPTTAWNS